VTIQLSIGDGLALARRVLAARGPSSLLCLILAAYGQTAHADDEQVTSAFKRDAAAFGNYVKAHAHAVGDAVGHDAKVVGHTVADGARSAGHAVSDGAKKVGKSAGDAAHSAKSAVTHN
jgi:hypothetical protein